MRADEILKKCAEIYNEKGKEYGHTYEDFGKIVMAYFPDGLSIKTEKEANKFGVFFMMMHKMMRIISSKFNSKDSMIDLSVYSALLKEICDDNK